MNDITLFSEESSESVEIALPDSIYDEFGFSPKEGREVAVCMANIASLDKQARYLIGNELFKIKEIVKSKHKGGGWRKFCEYLPYSWRTADSLIEEATNPEFVNLVNKFGTKGSHLILTAPKAIREEVKERAIERHEQGEPTKNANIQKLIADTKAELEKKVKEAEDEAKRERELRQETKNLLEHLMEEKEVLLEQNAELNKAAKVIEKEVIKEVIPEDYETLKQKESILKNAEQEAYRKIEMAKNKASEILTPIEDRVNELKDQENFLSGRVNQLTNDLSLFTTEERDREVRRKETDSLYKEIKSYLAVIGDTKVSEITLSEKQRIVELLEVTNSLSKLLSQWLGHSGNYIEGELV